MQSAPKVLTPARLAVLAAIKGWDAWTAKIQTIAEDDHEVHAFITQEPNISRCPLIAVSWQGFTPGWESHLMQRWPSLLFVSLWVPTREMTLAEQLIEDVRDAVFRFPSPGSTDAAPVSLVQKTCSQHPEIAGVEIAVPEERGQQGQHRLLRSSMAFNLRLQLDPLRRAS